MGAKIDTSPPFLDRILDHVLIAACSQYKPRSYFEIGTREGNSLMTVVNNANLDYIAVCDNWGIKAGGTNRGNADHIIELAKENGFSDRLTIYSGYSTDIVPTIEGAFDMILIDGDHSYDGCMSDMLNCWRLVKPGGIMLIDDLWNEAHDYLRDCVIEFGSILSLAHIVNLESVGIVQRMANDR